ncbi:MAG: hypothetical protein ABI886_04145 [Betaproteobacteria bacterium]
MPSFTIDETARTSPLALWRYGHDYLRAARELCDKHDIRCGESQVPYHIAAQGIEFALLAFLRAKGAPMADLRVQVSHSIAVALGQCQTLGMPALPAEWRPALTELAACHREAQFVYLEAPGEAPLKLESLILAGVWMLDCSAPDIAAHYVLHQGSGNSPTVEDFVRRMRADLVATVGATSALAVDASGVPLAHADGRARA